jgi:hypothetical protein
VRVNRGDLAGVEENFAAEMKIAGDPTIRPNYSSIVVQDFAVAAMGAWMLGRPDLARQRFAKMITVKANNPYELAMSQLLAAEFQFALRKYERAEALRPTPLSYRKNIDSR